MTNRSKSIKQKIINEIYGGKDKKFMAEKRSSLELKEGKGYHSSSYDMKKA